MLLNNRLIRRFALLLGVGIVVKVIITVIPYPELSGFLNSSYSLPVLDRNGELLYTIPLDDGLKRLKVNSDELPDQVIEAVLKSEDRWFYFHYGFNPVSIIRTAVQNHREGRVVSGASTISMQLARIINPRNKGMKSKIYEIIDAVRLEAKLSKREILSLYLSHLPFGKNMEGYQAASRFYLERDFSDLSGLETQVLSVIPRSPVHYDPINFPDRVKRAVLRIDETLSENYIGNTLEIIAESENCLRDPIMAPHFVNFVKSNLKTADYRKGEPVITTLDLSVQNWAENVINFYLDSASDNRVSNGSLLLLNGNEILAYVGSRNFFDKESQGQVDGVQILRQPGSTLKPFLYELAFEMGYNPASIIPDIPTDFGTFETYRPENYSQTYHGPVRIRTALGSSLNIPAVYMLERVGVSNFVKRLKKLGFNSLNGQEDNLGLGLAVGNAEVSLYELVQAFSCFKNEGYLDISSWKLRGKGSDPVAVMDSDYASVTRDILSDRKSRVLGFGRSSILSTGYPSYFKTGTSNQFNNIWALGATEDLTCGVWMGNFSGETVIGRPGSSLPARVVNEVLNKYSSKREFSEPTDVLKVDICSLSGGLHTGNCTTKISEYFKPGTTLEPCSYHKENGRIEFPVIYSQWLNMYSYDSYAFSDSISTVEILAPQNDSVFYLTPEFPEASQGVEFKITGTGPFSIESDGIVLHKGVLPFQGIVSIGKGLWKLDIVTDFGIKRSNIEIK